MAEWFVPATEGFPTWAEADPHESVLTLALEQLSPFRTQITAALDAAQPEQIADYLERLEQDDKQLFSILRVLFVGRYLACRPVWNVVGYPGQRQMPIREGEAEEYLAGGLLDQTIARGKLFRPTPPAGA